VASPTIPSATSLQILGRVIAAAGLAFGGAMLFSELGLLKRRRRARPDKPSGVRAALGATLMILGAVAAMLNATSAPEPDVISATRFSSGVAPSLSLFAVPGWRFAHDREAGRLAATDGKSHLMIETSRLSDKVDPPGFLRMMSDRAMAAGGTVEGPFTDTFDGLAATGIVIKGAPQSSVIWYVARGGPLITVVVCNVATAASARSMCRDVLATLRWR
jgi:hypothetical protein